jgi:hypothetical protein
VVEQWLMNIIDAADHEDSDDVETRRLLVAALRDSGLDLARVMNGDSPGQPPRSAGAAWRLRRMSSPPHRRRWRFGGRPNRRR